jgi:hypothetical protein
MRTYKTLICKNEYIEVDDVCNPQDVVDFLIEHRLDEITVGEWLSSLDEEDNGYSNYINFSTKTRSMLEQS